MDRLWRCGLRNVWLLRAHTPQEEGFGSHYHAITQTSWDNRCRCRCRGFRMESEGGWGWVPLWPCDELQWWSSSSCYWLLLLSFSSERETRRNCGGAVLKPSWRSRSARYEGGRSRPGNAWLRFTFCREHNWLRAPAVSLILPLCLPWDQDSCWLVLLSEWTRQGF